MGPVEFLVLAFPGGRVAAAVLGPLDRLRKAGGVRVLDARELRRGADGAATAEPGEAGLITDEDVESARELLGPDESALLLLVEHVWAAELTAAFEAERGRVAASVRIVPEEAEPDAG
ncbi:DUF6325 family protein [Streptacidiphilus neutrinimicus]|uniref:DUF6325 family protein n=1 Tax=Streptacidiphilus neutrinimicus TaxID=105420 RepID=UPI0005AAA352|nr:DUF6325 family protein [Streptacidiphilus neutrinimicus]